MKTTQILSHENLPPAERAGEGEVGGCTHRVQTAWLLLSLAVEKAFVGTGWAISLLCMNLFRKQPSGLVGPPFLTMTLFSWSIESLAETHDY